jgi:hypothetical protein
MIGEKILTNSGSMGPGVILLENLVMLLHKWNCNRPEDFIPIQESKVASECPSPPTLDQLRAALLEEWDNIPLGINALMNSMHRRIRAVTDARRGIHDIDELIDFTVTYVGGGGGSQRIGLNIFLTVIFIIT